MSSRDINELLGISGDPEVPEFEPGDWAKVRHTGVGIDWLAGAFGMDRRRVRAKIAGLKPIGMSKRGPGGEKPLYSLREAAGYLVPNNSAVSEAIRNMKAGDLPVDLQKDVWDARLKELQWRKLAGELWPTESVVEVLGDAFKNMKQSIQLWADNVESEIELQPEVRARIIEMADALQNDLHSALVAMPSKKQTPSVEAEVPKPSDGDDGI